MRRETRSAVHGKTGSPCTQVICVDKMASIAVKTYPGKEWIAGTKRTTFEPDYGGRGKLWTHGAFEPTTGQAAILMSLAKIMPVISNCWRRFCGVSCLSLVDHRRQSQHLCQSQVKLTLDAWTEVQILFIPKLYLLVEFDRALAETITFPSSQRKAV